MSEFARANAAVTSVSKALGTLADQAVKYVTYGFAPIPVPHGKKAPALAGWPNLLINTEDAARKYFSDANQNIGLLTGDLSCGLVDIDIDCDVALSMADHFLPSTGMITGRNTRPASHWFYKVDNAGRTEQFKSKDGEMVVEYRANGSQTIVPPSVYPDGDCAFFTSAGKPTSQDKSALLFSVKTLAAAAWLARHWPQGSRHYAALGLAGWLMKGGWSRDRVSALVNAICIAADDEEGADRLRTVRDTAERIARGSPIAGWQRLTEIFGLEGMETVATWLQVHPPKVMPVPGYQILPPAHNDNARRFSDADNADRLATMFGHRLRYNTDSRKWMVFNGRYWENDDTEQRLEFSKEVARSYLHDASLKENERYAKELSAHGVRSSQLGVLKNMYGGATHLLHVKQGQLDQDPFLLNCRNGTLDLKTGKLRPHSPEDFITRCIEVDYDPHAECPEFDRFMTFIFAGDEALVSFVWRLFGYGLTGDTREQSLFIFYGSGANGKSTLIGAMTHVVGMYAQQLPMSSLMANRQNGTNDIARMDGARLVTASESERTHKLAESLVKQLTGGDVISARYLYGEFFDFHPQCKIIMATNHKPEIQGTDNGIWRRVKLIPFNVTVPPGEQDKTLLIRLKAEAAGILRRLVDASRQWQNDGLKAPQAVEAATAGYRNEQDVIGRFITEICDQTKKNTIPKAELHSLFCDWCEAEGLERVDKTRFGKEISSRGFTERRTGKERLWVGIAIKTDDFNDEGLAA